MVGCETSLYKSSHSNFSCDFLINFYIPCVVVTQSLDILVGFFYLFALFIILFLFAVLF